MNTCLRLVSQIHTALLRLYPPGFREAFWGEMQAVFAQTASEAARQGAPALGRILLRELIDLPVAALHEHLLERRRRGLQAQAGAPRPVERLSRREMLVALAVFLIPAGLILLNAAPPSLIRGLIYPALLMLLLLGLVTGWVKRFPRWSLPYFGLIVSAIVFLFLFQWEAERIATLLASRFVVQPRDELGRLLLAAFWEGVVWLSLLGLVSFAILLLALLPRFRVPLRLLREDWTQLSYLLYGGSMLALVLTFKEYRYGEPYGLTALLCLAAGAWGYLRSSYPGRGFLALLGGATLAMWVAALGVWLLVPYQEWTAWFRWRPPESERWFAAEQALIGWAWMVVVMTLPGLLRLLPKPRDPTPAR